MVDFLRTLFHWPDGIVVGNLIASALWALPAVIHLHLQQEHNHREHMSELLKIRKRLGIMPYEVRKVEGDGYEVINKETGAVKAKHATKEDADRQVRLLHAVENNPNWEPTNA